MVVSVDSRGPASPRADGPPKITGIIYPPVDLRNIIDKTAQFVARLGAAFEGRVFEKEKDNPKFNFLQPRDAFHAYYKHKISEFKNELAPQQPAAAAPAQPASPPTEAVKEQKPTPAPAAPKLITAAARIVKPKQLEPPPQPDFIIDMPELSAQDLDIMRLTAQFVARNGSQFHMGLINREHKNPQFDFLKASHPLNPIFTALVDSYTRVLLPPRNIVDKLRSPEYRDKSVILEKAVAWMEWEQMQERARKKVEEAEEEERLAMAMIDWHDFVIVETIDFYDDERDLPAPATYEQLMGEGGAEEKAEVEMETDEMEMEEEEEPPKPPSPPSPPFIPERVPAPPSPPPEGPRVEPKLKILKEPIKRDTADKTNVLMQVCPRCGQKVPVDEMAEHMRIELLDPKFSAQKKMLAERKKDTALAEDEEIAKNLGSFARRRTDIFGTEEVEIGKSVGEEEERPPEKITWDGHTASIGRTTSAAMAGMTLEDQIAAIHASKGLLSKPPESSEKPAIGPHVPESLQQQASVQTQPRPIVTVVPPVVPMSRPVIAPPILPLLHPMMPPHMMPLIPPFGVHMPIPGVPAPPGMAPTAPPGDIDNTDERSAKRQKTDELNLIPEDQFLAQHPGPVTITVQVPPAPQGDKNEWNFQGQTLTMQLQLRDTVQTVMEKVKEQLGMPPNKQKLKAPGISILKNQNSLAYYNIKSGTVITLGVKERGGRKK
jgi:splicing factor 3A subunit 1